MSIKDVIKKTVYEQFVGGSDLGVGEIIFLGQSFFLCDS